jgi:hypothetical protein
MGLYVYTPNSTINHFLSITYIDEIKMFFTLSKTQGKIFKLLSLLNTICNMEDCSQFMKIGENLNVNINRFVRKFRLDLFCNFLEEKSSCLSSTSFSLG